jgi:hypothetical protein
MESEESVAHPLPTHPFHSSYHTPAPSRVSHHTPSSAHFTSAPSHYTPSPFLTFLSDDVSTVLEITSFREGGEEEEESEIVAWSGLDLSLKQGLGSANGGGVGNWTSGLNVTTSLVSTVTSAAPDFPAGYPSGYTWLHIILASIIVTVIIVIIVFGNFLVMWAIVRDKNLKGTQNYFIG